MTWSIPGQIVPVGTFYQPAVFLPVQKTDCIKNRVEIVLQT